MAVLLNQSDGKSFETHAQGNAAFDKPFASEKCLRRFWKKIHGG